MTMRGSAGDRMEYVPGALGGASPSSFLDAQAMRARAEEASRARALRFVRERAPPDLDAAAVAAAERERQARRPAFARWLDWQRRRFSAWRKRP